MNRTHSFVMVAVLSGILAAGAGAFAQDAGRTGGRDGGRRGVEGRGALARDGGLPLRGVDLTDAQKRQIETLTTQNREQNRAAFEQLRAADEAFGNAVDASPVNEQAIRVAAQSLATARAEAGIAQAKLRTSIFALLTPEQQAQVTKLRSERDARRPRQRS